MSLENTLSKEFEILESHMNGTSDSDIHQIRKTAMNRFNTLGFPTTKNEDWKYTNLAAILKNDFSQIILNTEEQDLNLDLSEYWIQNLEVNLLVFVNGKFVEKRSVIKDKGNGLVLGSLESAIKLAPQLISQHFAQYANSEEESFVNLNTAFAQDGAFIHVPDNKVLDHPVIILHITDGKTGTVFSQPRHLVIAGSSSKVKVVEIYQSQNRKGVSLCNSVTEISAADNAIVEHYKLQEEGTEATNISEVQVYQQRDSRVYCHSYALDGDLMRNKTNMVLDDENCEGHLYGLYVLEGQQHVDNRSLVDHAKPHCFSNELYKGVIGGQAKGVFNGRIMVREDAQKTNAFQSNKNILMSDDAHIFTKPQLEIFADDVKCTHGATTGQLDDDAIFYLRSRGLTKDQARVYLLHAFTDEVLEHCTIEPLKEHVRKKVNDRLDAMA